MIMVGFWLRVNPVSEFHLGDCVGADSEAFDLATCLGIPCIGHPPTDGSKRAFRNYALSWPCKPYLVRNRDIVACASVLIAAPKEYQTQLRSGTWATVRAAIRQGTTTVIAFPNGDIGNV